LYGTGCGDDHQAAGLDLMRGQYRWPVGMPLCRAIGDGCWEVCTSLPSNRIARVLFSVQQSRILGLHRFIKKTQKTPSDERDRNLRILGMKETNMAKKKKAIRSTVKLTTFDDFLSEDSKRDEFEAIAVKEVLAWQIAQAMKEKNISRNSLAQRMKTSRSQIGRLLDPKDGNVTLATLQRAARMVGRTLRLELV
jgi:antitoxin HicB